MEWILYIVAFGFFLVGIGCLFLVAISLPGGWIMLGLAGLIEYLDYLYLPAENTQTFDWWILIACGVLLLIGEVIEFIAGVAGAKKGGASRRGMIGSIIGGILGAFIFTPIFFFVPLFGTLLGAILGTFVGAIVGELSGQDASMKGSMKPAMGATIGRVIGTVSKVGIGIAVWLTLTVSAFWP